MLKKSQVVWIFFFYCLMFMEGGASNPPSTAPQQILQCQLSLQKISAHLRQIAKDRTNQKYYANLYQQTQDFLKRWDAAPLNSLEAEEMWEQCQNLTKAIRCIVGHPIPVVKGISSLSPQGNCPSGQLTTRRLDGATVTEIRRYRHRGIKYVCRDHATTAKSKAKKEKEEEVGSVEDVTFISSSLPKKGLRTKSIDELENRD
jgi:hypothetical protein